MSDAILGAGHKLLKEWHIDKRKREIARFAEKIVDAASSGCGTFGGG